MKAILIILVLLLFQGCARFNNGLSGTSGHESEQEAQKYFERFLTKCGDSYIAAGIGAHRDQVYEWKPAKISVEQEQLHEADKLNGVEWKGTSKILAKAYREYRTYSDGGTWTNWAPPVFVPGANFQKNGKWEFPTQSAYGPIRLLQCA